MRNILIVGLGGFLGAGLRYIASGLVHRMSGESPFPFGTLAVNLFGCLIIGLIGGWSESSGTFSQETKLFVFIGLLGGFTTFSTFGNDTVLLLRNNQLLHAMTNVMVHVCAGLFAVWCGFRISTMT